jgi:hypothetical protein
MSAEQGATLQPPFINGEFFTGILKSDCGVEGSEVDGLEVSQIGCEDFAINTEGNSDNT